MGTWADWAASCAKKLVAAVVLTAVLCDLTVMFIPELITTRTNKVVNQTGTQEETSTSTEEIKSRLKQIQERQDEYQAPKLARFDASRAVFLKVPKTGTTTFGELFGAVAGKNDAEWHMCTMAFANMHKKKWEKGNFIKKAFTPQKSKGYKCDKFYPKSTTRVPKVPTRMGFAGHLRFVDFQSGNAINPVWVSVIRQPISRFLSSYYWYRRQSWSFNHHQHTTKDRSESRESWTRRTAEQCIQRRRPECVFRKNQTTESMIHNNMVAFFCGLEDPFCNLHGSPLALQKAKENVERFFHVIGVLEDMNTSLQVFENVVPQFFTGLTNTSVPKSNAAPSSYETLSPESEAYLKEAFKDDFEFYDFVIARLKRQHNKI